MERTLFGRLFTFCALIALSAPSSAAVESTGISRHGAAYRIVVPDGWRAGDGLVLVQHGFRFGQDLDPDLGPLRERMLADGYAVAASGYRHHGWATFAALDDNAELLAIFRARYGEPGHLVAAGGSMGGLIALRLAEDPRFRDRTEGVLALCPVTNGLQLWERAFDLRLTYDALCADVDGGQLPRGSQPTPWALDEAFLVAALALPDDERALLPVAAPVAVCTGLGAPSALRSDSMRRRLAALAEVAGTSDEDALAQLLAYSVFGLSDLVRDPGKFDERNPFDNIDARWTRATSPNATTLQQVDARVARVDGDGVARLQFEDRDRLDGSATARIVSLHTRRDPIVSLREQAEVQNRYGSDARFALVAIADETSPSHCGFSPAELASGWDTLQQWRARAVAERPAVADLQRACVAIGDGACRWRDATFEVVYGAPRPPPARGANAPIDEPLSGLWYDLAHDGQGLMIEELDWPFGAPAIGEQRVAVSWYTWAPGTQAESGPRWLIGVGRLRDNGFVVDDVLLARSGTFGTRPPLAPPALEPWGRIDFAVERDGVRLHYDGPASWGSGIRPQVQLTRSGHAIPWGVELSPLPEPAAPHLGTYYSAAHEGQGWVLNQFVREGTADVESALLWYTFDSSGRPIWMYGLDASAADGLRFRMQWASGGGTFNGATAPTLHWGEVWLETSACAVTAVNWRAETHGFGDGRIAVQRLSEPYEYGRGTCEP